MARNHNFDGMNVQTWNMCQGASHCPERWTIETVDRLEATILNAARKPRFISLQEVCYSLWDNIEAALDTWYEGRFKISNAQVESPE